MIRNRMLSGVGINDADYKVTINDYSSGKKKLLWFCPFYNKWSSMIWRCYSPAKHAKSNTYADCFVSDEWLTFSNFRSWMIDQPWEGKQLDKDLLFVGNKVYSKEACVFVDPVVNTFANDSGAIRGNFLIGVNWDKREEMFKAQCRNPFTHTKEHLGYFADEMEAHLKWKARKHELACLLADSQHVTDPRLAAALKVRYLHINKLGE